MKVEELLQKHGIYYIPKGKDFVVKCINPEHDDGNPSMRIDQISGIFQCFSCEYKGNLYKFFGEKPVGLEIEREKLRRKIGDKMAESSGLSYPKNSVPYRGNWRQIKPESYEIFEAFLTESDRLSGRIVFPVRSITGRISAFIGRHMTAGHTPKYLISPPGATLPLYPQAEPINSSVILVEGIFDALNLYDKGLTNAVCCFGVKNVDEDKLSILKMSGVDTVITFFDNDDAGQKGAQLIESLCEKVSLKYSNIAWGDKDRDAGSMTQTQVLGLKRKLYG